jgi:hypothetical protein
MTLTNKNIHFELDYQYVTDDFDKLNSEEQVNIIKEYVSTYLIQNAVDTLSEIPTQNYIDNKQEEIAYWNIRLSTYHVISKQLNNQELANSFLNEYHPKSIEDEIGLLNKNYPNTIWIDIDVEYWANGKEPDVYILLNTGITIAIEKFQANYPTLYRAFKAHEENVEHYLSMDLNEKEYSNIKTELYLDSLS